MLSSSDSSIQWFKAYVDFFDRNIAHFLYIGYTTTAVHLTELISYRDEAALYMTKNLDMSYAMDMIKKPVFQVTFFFLSLTHSFFLSLMLLHGQEPGHKLYNSRDNESFFSFNSYKSLVSRVNN